MKSSMVLACAALLLLPACGGSDGPDAAPTTAATTETPSPSPTASAAPTYSSELLTYDEDTGAVKAEADAAQLKGAPADFQQFLADTIAKSASSTDCPEGVEITVDKLRPDGWARGNVFEKGCGGYAVLWAHTGGAWKQVWGGQDLYDCPTLTKYRFPTDVVGTQCYDATKNDAVTYEG